MSLTKNAELKDIGGILKEADSVLIFVHQNPDGDALGSSIALCKTLRKLGKEAWILLEENIAAYYSFIESDCCTLDKECIADPDICICLDCSEYSRFETIKEIYSKGRTRLCIDHHLNDKGFGEYYYIDSDAAACAEIVFELIRTMDVEIDKDIANCIYIGISSDTGNFKYSNTTKNTHRIAAELFEYNIDHNDIMVNLYQNVRLSEVEVKNMALSGKKMLADGRGAMAMVTQEILDACNADIGDAETVIDALRDISGVEIAAVLKERGDKIKLSMRAKTTANVAEIAMSFGGGGHVKAAGATLDGPIEAAAKLVEAAVIKALDN